MSDPLDSLREMVGLMLMDGYKSDDIKEAVDDAIASHNESQDEKESEQ